MHRLGVLTRGVGITLVGFVLVELLLAAASGAVPRRTGARLSGQCFLVDLHGRHSNRMAITTKLQAWPDPANQTLRSRRMAGRLRSGLPCGFLSHYKRGPL